jgi:acetylornithine deacetylase
LNTRDLLEKLIGFDTVSRNPNRELMDFVAHWLREHGIESRLIPNADGSKANLYASILPAVGQSAGSVARAGAVSGPVAARGAGQATGSGRDPGVSPTAVAVANPGTGGIMLSGHTDVVPVDGQAWTLPAFAMTEQDGRYYGRGSADMKGFVACALSAMAAARDRHLTVPLHLALSYDEEIGCVGVRSLVEHLSHQSNNPRLCIVGEPTEMNVAIRHKGKRGIHATFIGREGHSALAPQSLNAIHLACDFISHLRELQQSLAAPFAGHDDTEVPYTTVHAGLINGGTALNIVPNRCTVVFEIRNTDQDDPDVLLDSIKAYAHTMIAVHQARIPEADVSFEQFNDYPGLSTPEDSWAVQFVKSLTGANGCTEVAFGTEAGLFSSQLHIPSVVCGPGSMAQGHKPDEYISIDQMHQCEQMLARLLDRMCEPDSLH